MPPATVVPNRSPCESIRRRPVGPAPGYIRGEAREQVTMFPVTLEELIPADHLCRVIEDLRRSARSLELPPSIVLGISSVLHRDEARKKYPEQLTAVAPSSEQRDEGQPIDEGPRSPGTGGRPESTPPRSRETSSPAPAPHLGYTPALGPPDAS